MNEEHPAEMARRRMLRTERKAFGGFVERNYDDPDDRSCLWLETPDLAHGSWGLVKCCSALACSKYTNRVRKQAPCEYGVAETWSVIVGVHVATRIVFVRRRDVLADNLR